MGYYPLVSVIIATYNAGKYLRRALDSVYSQSYTNVECIVVDGCSKDNTLDIVREYVCKILCIYRSKIWVFMMP